MKIFLTLLLSIAGYFLFGYFLKREDFLQVAAVYLILFAGYLYLLKRGNEVNLKLLLTAAIIFRLLFLFSIPAMSDDYFRFIWDGTLIAKGINPFEHLPSSFIQNNNDEYLKQLFMGMNSKEYYSVYPPICQLIFATAAFLFPGNLQGAVLVLHAVCIAAEAGSIFILLKLLSYFQLPKQNILLYALNPLVIIELSGNLHFEAVMIFFLLLAIYLLLTSLRFQLSVEQSNPRNLDVLSAIAYAFAVCTKLIPLLFLPFLIKRMKAKSIIYFLITGIVCVLLFLPFISTALISNMGSSVDLYFQKFEFNASIYYLIRWIGFQMNGYNIIQSAGPWLALAVFIAVMFLVWKEKKLDEGNFFEMMQLALTIFLLLSTTVHPWYITTLVMLSVITGYRFAIVWSLVVVLSYATYQTNLYEENLWLTTVEYVAVVIVLGMEIIVKKAEIKTGY